MITALILVSHLYVICVFAAAGLWGVSIWKSYRARQFAFDRVSGRLPGFKGSEGRAINRDLILRFVSMRLRKLDKILERTRIERLNRLPAINQFEVDLISLFILRKPLGIETDFFAMELAKANSNIVDWYLSRVEDVKRQIESEAKHLGPLGKKVVIERFVENLRELSGLVEESRIVGAQSASSVSASPPSKELVQP